MTTQCPRLVHHGNVPSRRYSRAHLLIGFLERLLDLQQPILNALIVPLIKYIYLQLSWNEGAVVTAFNAWSFYFWLGLQWLPTHSKLTIRKAPSTGGVHKSYNEKYWLVRKRRPYRPIIVYICTLWFVAKSLDQGSYNSRLRNLSTQSPDVYSISGSSWTLGTSTFENSDFSSIAIFSSLRMCTFNSQTNDV